MDKYLHYNHIELSEDPSFIKWTKGSADAEKNDWDQWLEIHPEKANDVEQAKAIVLAMKFVEQNPTEIQKDAVWAKIRAEVNTPKESVADQKPRRRGIIKMLAYGAVAAVALILLFQNIGDNYDTTVNVPFAKVERIQLPDGSNVTINADSELKYDVKSWEKDRVVALQGEAFFEVKKGSRFRVKTNNGQVQVLGTSFNVFARGSQFAVVCETGKVSVKSNGNEAILSPQQSVSKIGKENFSVEDVMKNTSRSVWRNGVFMYKGAALNEVVAELERQFDISITMDERLSSVLYTGSFKKDNIETAFEEVFFPLGLKYKIEGKSASISK